MNLIPNCLHSRGFVTLICITSYKMAFVTYSLIEIRIRIRHSTLEYMILVLTIWSLWETVAPQIQNPASSNVLLGFKSLCHKDWL